jgi:hypothetical protein
LRERWYFTLFLRLLPSPLSSLLSPLSSLLSPLSSLLSPLSSLLSPLSSLLFFLSPSLPLSFKPRYPLVPDAYFSPLEPSGKRHDHASRPELSRGSVDLVASAEYIQRSLSRPSFMFVIDVSEFAVTSGLLDAVINTLRILLSELAEACACLPHFASLTSLTSLTSLSSLSSLVSLSLSLSSFSLSLSHSHISLSLFVSIFCRYFRLAFDSISTNFYSLFTHFLLTFTFHSLTHCSLSTHLLTFYSRSTHFRLFSLSSISDIFFINSKAKKATEPLTPELVLSHTTQWSISGTFAPLSHSPRCSSFPTSLTFSFLSPPTHSSFLIRKLAPSSMHFSINCPRCSAETARRSPAWRQRCKRAASRSNRQVAVVRSCFGAELRQATQA